MKLEDLIYLILIISMGVFLIIAKIIEVRAEVRLMESNKEREEIIVEMEKLLNN